MRSPALWLLCVFLPLVGVSSAQQKSIIEISGEARQAYTDKKYDQYVKLMHDARAIAPNNPAVAWGLARGYARIGNAEESLKWLQRLIALQAYYDVKAAPDFDEIRKDDLRKGSLASLTAELEKLKQHTGTSEVAFRFADPGLNPESIAYDPKDKGFFLGSSKRKIAKWTPNATIPDWGSSTTAGLWTVLGIKLDAKRRELWVNSCNLGPGGAMSPADPESIGSAGIFRFNADTGALISKHIVGTKEKPGCVNDLAITPDGHAFATFGPPANGGSILRVDRSTGKVETFYQPDGSFFGNGIALDEKGKTLYVSDSARGVLVIDVATRTGKSLTMPDNIAMTTIDGLYLHRGAIIAIQNAPAITRVARYPLNQARDGVTSVETLERNHPAFTLPTTGVIVGNTLYYVANTAVRDAKENDTLEAVILKVSLSSKK